MKLTNDKITTKSRLLFYFLFFSLVIILVGCTGYNISLGKETVNLMVGDTETVVATVTPANKTGNQLYWVSSNIDVASVNQKGEIFARGVGEAVITVSLNNVEETINVVVIDEYEVRFHTNGGSDIETIKVLSGNVASEPIPPTKLDYKFDGWFTDGNLEYKFAFNTTISSDLILYASWKLETITVNFEVNGGNELESRVIKKGTKVSLPFPTKAGKVFDGWYEDANFSVAFALNTVLNEDITLYAKWGSEPYTITFDTDNGSEVDSQTKIYGEKVTQPANPTRPYFNFLGWYSDSTYTIAFDFNEPIKGDTTLYAKWKAQEFNIVYDLNGGKWDTPLNSVRTALLTDFYEYIHPQMSLSIFMHGVGKSSGFDGRWYEFVDQMYGANITSRDTSQPYFINQPVYYDKWIGYFNLLDELVTEINPEQTLWGDTWAGSIRIREYITGYTTTGAIRYSDSQFSRRPEGLDLAPKIYNYESNFNLFPLTKSGYRFAGWYNNPGFTGEAINNIIPGMTGDIYLYAKWDVY